MPPADVMPAYLLLDTQDLLDCLQCVLINHCHKQERE